MFVYCSNCPVRYSDPCGNAFIEALIVTVGFEWTVTIVIFGVVIVCDVVYRTLDALVNWLSQQWYYPYLHITIVNDSIGELIIEEYASHTKNQSERNRNKHEQGDARRQRDQGGEKKKQQKAWRPNPNKRGGLSKYEKTAHSMY